MRGRLTGGAGGELGLFRHSGAEGFTETFHILGASRSGPRSPIVWCPVCQNELPMITVSQAAKLVHLTPRTVYAWAKQGKLHAAKVLNLPLCVCQASLASIQKPSAKSDQVNHSPTLAMLALRLIRQRFADPNLSLRELAGGLGRSLWYVGRILKKCTGLGFRQYLKTLRLRRAEKLLLDPSLLVKQVAAAVGYKHVSDFDHHFKAAYGIAPGEYRRHHLSN